MSSIRVASESQEPCPGQRARHLRPADVLRWLLLWLLYVLVYAWFVLIFGLIAAYFGRLLAVFLGRTAQHWAWITGAVAGLVGVPLGQVRIGSMKKIPRPPWRPKRASREPDPLKAIGRSRRVRPVWVTRDGLHMALFGLIFGSFVGFVLLTSWFSISMSPFAPASWSESVTDRDDTSRTDPMGRSEPDSRGLTTRHPMAFILFLVPPAVLALLGFILGGFLGGPEVRR